MPFGGKVFHSTMDGFSLLDQVQEKSELIAIL
jgi:hypothetical protein